MKSLFTRDPFPPIRVTGYNISDLIIPSIVVLLIVLLWFSLSYFIWSADTIKTGRFLMKCPIGQCGTNVYTGEKRCPVQDEAVLISPEYEVCNSRYVCENSRTPYALLSDGSTNSYGVCDDNTICRCLSSPTCGTYLSSGFRVINGSLFDSASSRYLLEQTTAKTNSTNEFCSIKGRRLNRVVPGGCPFSDADWNNSPSTVLTQCLSRSATCTSGVLALLPENPSLLYSKGLSNQDANNTPVGCVNAPSNPCTNPNEAIPIWDFRTETLRCTFKVSE